MATDEAQIMQGLVLAGKAILGTERVLQRLLHSQIQKVYLAKNCPQPVRRDLLRYAGLRQVPVVELGMSAQELGVLCKKNYFVAVVGIP